ncbi:tail fiber assembly protein [Cronobacter sakazakii]|nr:tail fiber assembly protein [Cronobacter sakazakii]
MNKNNVAVLDELGITTVAGYKKIYNYRAETGEFTGSNDEYLPVGVGIPACSTVIPNPSCEAGEVAIFNGELGRWVVQEDHRGETVYSIETGTPFEVIEIGPIPNGYTLSQPSSKADEWNGKEWVRNDEKAKELAMQEAENKKNTLLTEANAECNELMVDYNLGLLTNEQTEKLKIWRIYIRDLKAVDTSAAPNIEWPEVPKI